MEVHGSYKEGDTWRPGGDIVRSGVGDSGRSKKMRGRFGEIYGKYIEIWGRGDTGRSWMDIQSKNRKIHGRFGNISNGRSMADTGRSNMECSGMKLEDLWEMRSDR
jgi:hypothetical protein